MVTALCFAKVKYLVITELTIATLFSQVFVMMQQMSFCQFLYFSSRLICGLLITHRTPPAALLLHTNRPSAVPVKFKNYNDSVTRVAGRLRVLTMSLRDILLQDKEDHLDQVHAEQMVLKMIRVGEAGPVEP